MIAGFNKRAESSDNKIKGALTKAVVEKWKNMN